MSKINSRLIKTLHEIIGKYTFDQRSIISENQVIGYSPITEEIYIHNYYGRDRPNLTAGSCAELRDKTYHEIRHEFPNIHQIRATGRWPAVKKNVSTHNILLLSTKNLMGDWIVQNNENIEEILNENPLLIDTTRQIIMPAKEAEFEYKTLIKQDVILKYSNSMKYKEGNPRLPIGIIKDDKVLSIALLPKSDKKIAMGITSPQTGHVTKYSIDNPTLKKELKDFQELDKIRQFLENQKIQYVKKLPEPKLNYAYR